MPERGENIGIGPEKENFKAPVAEPIDKQEAADNLVETWIKKGELWNAFEAAKLGASAETFDKLVHANLSEGRNDETIRAALIVAKAGASPKGFHELRLAAVVSGDMKFAREVAEASGEKLTATEIKEMNEASQSKK